MPFVSSHTLVETSLSASPVKAFIDKAVALGRPAVAYTDLGYLTGAFKFYKAAKQAGLNFIPGIEMMFLDTACPSHAVCPETSYFSITAYGHDKDAYHALIKASSQVKEKYKSKTEDEYPLYNWADLETLSKYNVSFVMHGSLSLYYRVYENYRIVYRLIRRTD